MGKRTGRPRGRPKGAQSKFTKERQARIEATAQMLNEVLPEPFEGDSHDFLMAVYKDTRNPLDVRLDAAKAAIGFEKPRLAATQMTVDDKRTVEQFTDAELEALAAASSRRAVEAEEGASGPH